ncbi:MAG: TRAP transporter small permease subunit [Anaerotignum faecicola]
MAGILLRKLYRKKRKTHPYRRCNQYLPKKARPYIEILSEVIVLCFAIFIAVTGYTVFGKIAWSGQMSPAMRIPMQFVYAAPMIGMGLTAIRQLQCIYRRIKALKNHEEVTEA